MFDILKDNERRMSKRFNIKLYGLWTEKNQGVPVRSVNISSKGVRFECSVIFPLYTTITLQWSWPVPAGDKQPMVLLTSGKVLRSDGKETVIEITWRKLQQAPASPGSRLPQESERGQQAGKRISQMTVRQYQILSLAARHMTTKQIAAALTLSPHTIEAAFATLKNKVGVARRDMLIEWFLQKGQALSEYFTDIEQGPVLSNTAIQ